MHLISLCLGAILAANAAFAVAEKSLPPLTLKGMDDPALRAVAAVTLDEYGYTVYERKLAREDWEACRIQLTGILADSPSEFACFLLSGVCQTLSAEPGDEYARQGLDAAAKLLALAPDNPIAVAEYSAALEDIPDSSELQLDYANRALALEPDCLAALSLKADALEDLGEPEAGLGFRQRGLELAPEHAVTQYALGTALMALERFVEAEPVLMKVLAQEPQDPYTLSELGHIALELERVEDARVCFDKALAAAPNHGNAVYGLARIAALEDRPLEALALLDRAIELKPKSALAHNLRGVVLSDTGRIAEAAAEYEIAAGLAPDDAVIRTNLASKLMDLGKDAEAEVQWRMALDLQPGDWWVWSRLASCLYGQGGRNEEGLAAVEKGMELEATGSLYNLRGLFLLRLERVDEGISAHEAAVQLEAGNPVFAYNLGAAYERAGRPGEALSEFERSYELDPADADTQARVEKLKLRLAQDEVLSEVF